MSSLHSGHFKKYRNDNCCLLRYLSFMNAVFCTIINDMWSRRLPVSKIVKSVTPHIYDMQSGQLPASLIARSQFLMKSISANFNSESKRLGILCNCYVPLREVRGGNKEKGKEI
jgi:hypothetical protein